MNFKIPGALLVACGVMFDLHAYGICAVCGIWCLVTTINALEEGLEKHNREENMTTAEIEDLFTYHPPQGNQPQRYESIRAAAKVFAQVLVLNTPVSADQSAAIRKLRECVMTANASIALEKSGEQVVTHNSGITFEDRMAGKRQGEEQAEQQKTEKLTSAYMERTGRTEMKP